MMTKRGLVRASTVALVLVAAIAASQATITYAPVFATVLRFTSSSTQSTVEVIVSNPNPVSMGGTLILVVVQPNGVLRIWPAGYVEFPAGNSNHRVIIPAAIAGVRSARVINTEPCW